MVSRRGCALLGTALLAALAAACGDGDAVPAEPGMTATVRFIYEAPTAIDPAVRQAFPDCVNGVGMTHIHPGWRDFARLNMIRVGSDRWEFSFDDVPINQAQRIRISDPNACAASPTGAATQNVSANGTRLTRIVDTPGSGTEPGLGFTVAADGTVMP